MPLFRCTTCAFVTSAFVIPSLCEMCNLPMGPVICSICEVKNNPDAILCMFCNFPLENAVVNEADCATEPESEPEPDPESVPELVPAPHQPAFLTIPEPERRMRRENLEQVSAIAASECDACLSGEEDHHTCYTYDEKDLEPLSEFQLAGKRGVRNRKRKHAETMRKFHLFMNF